MDSKCKLICSILSRKAICVLAALCQLVRVPPAVPVPGCITVPHGMHKHCNILWQSTLEEATALGTKQWWTGQTLKQ